MIIFNFVFFTLLTTVIYLAGLGFGYLLHKSKQIKKEVE